MSAREFVAWYNGLPNENGANSFKLIENQLKKCSTLSIIGQGNVAIDVARILLSPIDALRKTDITKSALNVLAECNIKNVNLIGRRGPLQAAFTIKELREMLKLPNVNTIWRDKDLVGIDEVLISKLPRAKKRITELMLKSATSSEYIHSAASKQFSPIFFRSPTHIEATNENKDIHLIVNTVNERESAVATDQTEIVKTEMILRSIGYKSRNVTHESDSLNFDRSKGLVLNENGRVLKTNGYDDDKYERGLYVSGWLGTGPVGVILSTMSNSFAVASHLCKDVQQNVVDCSSKPGLDLAKYSSTISWSDWQKIDKYEVEKGALVGKPREKILDVTKMLEITK